MTDQARRWTTFVAVSVAVCAGCASTHDFGKDGGFSATGGGHYEEAVSPGFFYIVAKTTVGPMVSHGAARGMWQERAKRLCIGAYHQIEISEAVEEPIPPALPGMHYYITVQKGYALCDSSPLSVDQATRALDDGARISQATPVPAKPK